ncbi:uncharacterized protein ZBAI_04225 [Zygosaccharomyces bailii ISA1307]|nr:uncharacterized protein ZBAI_04225 [Zygosaccharomyces bailii ISA1307]
MPHPPSHRVGDKRRYYYYSSNPRHGGFKKGFQSLSSGQNVPQQPIAASPGTAGPAARHSRYDPHSPRKPMNRVGSRYNPDVEIGAVAKSPAAAPSSSITAGVNNNITSVSSTASSPGCGVDGPIMNGSRYSGSRYNPQPRPRSVDSTKKEMPVLTNANSASGYYSRSNKWRMGGTPASKLDYDNYGSSQFSRAPFYKSRNRPSLPSSVKTTTPPTAPQHTAVSHHTSVPQSSSLPVIPQTQQIQIQAETQSKKQGQQEQVQTQSPAAPQLKQQGQVQIQPQTQSPQGSQSEAAATRSPSPTLAPSDDSKLATTEKKTEGTTSTETETSTERDTPAVTNNNPHSLGASLINSVPQPLRKPQDREDTESEDKMDTITKLSTINIWSSSPKDKSTDCTGSCPHHEDYEHIYEPEVLRTNLESLREDSKLNNKFQSLQVMEDCIFPMNRAQTRLWELKSQPRRQVTAQQSHLLKNPIKSLQTYPFFRQNIVIHKQALKPLLCRCISKLRRYEYLRKLRLKQALCKVEPQWQENCAKMDAMSHELRKEEICRKEEAELELKERERREKELQERQARLSGSSRRRNRADFVDDAEMENVLLQIDPVYKHLQCAAEIPPMIRDPLKKNAIKFKDVNNLVTDKNSWARRIIKDGEDSFTQHEHELFVEAYLSYPKKFLKISNYMGGLRSPEECVLHYYRTKSSAAYKKLLNDKNKKRQKSNSAKRSKKRERASDTDNEHSLTLSEHVDHDGKRRESSGTMVDAGRSKVVKHMEQVEIKLIEDQNRSQQTDGGVFKADDAATQERPVVSKDGTVPKKEENTYETLGTPNGRRNSINDISASADATKGTTEANSAAASSPSQNGNSSVVKAFTSSADQREVFGESYESSNDEGQQRKRHKHPGEHKSSYWSVKEATFFPELLKQYGSQWSLISEKLGTKSTTMVRNYYQRNAAQFGWKPLVEEADFKRNATSSGSVQQSQILLQSEQTPLSMSNGVPSQLWPALGFFTNGSTKSGNGPNEEPPTDATPDKKTSSLPSQATEKSAQPFSSNYNKDSLFPELSSSASGLPAPRLPSIQLPASSEVKKEKAPYTGSQLKDLLNEDRQDDARPSTTWHRPATDSFGHTSPPSAEHIQLSNTVRPRISNLVVQELQGPSGATSGSRRSSSLSLLLNPENDRTFKHNGVARSVPQQKLVHTPAQFSEPHPSSAQLQQHNEVSSPPTPASKINFAMDPLGALAAVASESLLQTDGSNKSSL